ncbi:hypothetical protein [Microvirga sp. TS319]|uniref:hypothetical protein n=1 Tax=Microvirga sp. TS319 TaxID=3241165 RepID=UPI00351A482B
MAVRDIDIVAELLARIGGSWHPERPRPAPNGISSRHRDVARLILAELRRRDAARNEALGPTPEPTGQDVTPGATDGVEIPVGAVVAYCPPGDTRTITCTVEKIERGRAYLVPVRREIGWISTNTFQPLPSQTGRPKTTSWPRTGQALPYRDGGASLSLNAPLASSGTERQSVAPAARVATALSNPGREPAGTPVQARLPQENSTPPVAPPEKPPQKASAPAQVLPVKAPDAPSKPAKGGTAATKVQNFFDSSGQWVAFRLHRNDRYLFNTKGKWIGWFPWKDGEVVDIHGRYLGTVLDTDRLYRKKSSPPSGRKAGFVLPPGDPGYAGYAERVAFCNPPYGYQDIDWESLPVGRHGRLKSTRLAVPAGAGYVHRFLLMIGLTGLLSRIARAMQGTDAR